MILVLIPVLYIGLVWIKFGVQISISHSYYKFKDKYSKYAFTLFCWSIAYSSMILGADIYIFFSGILLGITGVTPAFRSEKIVNILHCIGAYGSVIFSQITIFVNYDLWYINIFFFSFFFLSYILKIKNKTWWVEIAALLSIYYTLLR